MRQYVGMESRETFYEVFYEECIPNNTTAQLKMRLERDKEVSWHGGIKTGWRDQYGYQDGCLKNSLE